MVLDEYQYGAWRENAKGLFGADEEDEGKVADEVTKVETEFDESSLPITTGSYLGLSGTPFRALASGEFIEEQVHNWTYSDEQRSERDWNGPGPNSYASLLERFASGLRTVIKISRRKHSFFPCGRANRREARTRRSRLFESLGAAARLLALARKFSGWTSFRPGGARVDSQG